MKRNTNFEWYVLNIDFNNRKVEQFNIFNNCTVYKKSIELLKQYQKDKDFNKFVDEFDNVLRWQEWSRCEYEIIVSDLILDSVNEKWDCYQQCIPNMEIICKYLIDTYFGDFKKKSKRLYWSEEKDYVNKKK